MNRTALAGIVALALSISSICQAQRATDAEMARDALGPFIQSSLPAEEKRALIQELHSLVSARARSTPNELSSATVVFKKGLTIKHLARIAESFALEVAGMNVKAPLNDMGIVQTLLIGSDDLLRPKGSFEARAEHAIGHHRYQFLKSAESLPEGEAKDVRKMAKSPMRIYACDVIGSAQSLFALTSHPDVEVVVPDHPERSEGKISSYLNLKREYQDAWRRLEEPMQD
jgi:hypothetical protein